MGARPFPVASKATEKINYFKNYVSYVILRIIFGFTKSLL